MSNSAITTRATERKLATASRLTARCRELTADRGLAGFTIEEVCSEVGVSRRTFFNYFPTKEDAIFGVEAADGAQSITEDFLARGSRGWPAVIDDLVAIAGGFVDETGVTAVDHAIFLRALEREPRLLARFIGVTREREASLVHLVARREGVSVNDARARASVEVFTTIFRSVIERLSDPVVAENFGAALLDSLAATRAVLAPSA